MLFSSFASILVGAASTASAAALPKRSKSASITPHDMYSSSIGVLGCKIDTNRVAYWPNSVDCDNICVEVSYSGRTVTLLRIDQSEGAHDISYDAYNYLTTGHGAREDPTDGGPIAMEYRYVDADNCKDLIDTEDGKLPISAANSMNYMAMCLAQSDSWVANNHVFYNILDPICSLGHDEVCTLDWPTANTPTCDHTTGIPDVLEGEEVINIRFPTGELILSTTNTIIDDYPQTSGSSSSSSSSSEDSDTVGGVFTDKVSTMAITLLTMLVNFAKSASSESSE